MRNSGSNMRYKSFDLPKSNLKIKIQDHASAQFAPAIVTCL